MHPIFYILLLAIHYSDANKTSIGIQNSDATSNITAKDTGTHIIGGEPALDDELNFLVLIEAQYQANGQIGIQHCGGSLISNDTVLTAAHCLIFIEDWISNDKITIRYGNHNTKNMKTSSIKWYNVNENFDYSNEGSRYDIALIKLTEELDITERIKTIGIASDYDLSFGMLGTTAGWGRTSYNSKGISEQLLKTTIRVYDTTSMLLPFCGVHDANFQFCAGQPWQTDSCEGDSGGPFVVNNKLYGIVSRAALNIPCDGFGIYVKVSSHSSWISDNYDEYSKAINFNAHNFLILGAIFFLLCLPRY